MNPLVIAHRGGAGEAFENSMEAFQYALSIQCDSIEVDLRATKDGQIIVMHDETLNRTAQGTGKVNHHTLKEISKLHLKNGEQIPSLHDLLKLARQKIQLHLEVKEAGFEEELVNLIDASGMAESVVVISFHHEIIARVHELNPALKTGFLFEDESGWAKVPDFCGLAVPFALLLNENRIKTFKYAGKTVHAWVVNDPDQARKLTSLGVNGIISDFPSRLLQTTR